MLPLAHKQSELYQKAIQLGREVYRLTESFPADERTALVYTLRRLTILLCQDIATSAAKQGKKQRRVLETCIEHCVALDAQLELAIAVNIVGEENTRDAATLLRFIFENVTQLMKKKIIKK